MFTKYVCFLSLSVVLEWPNKGKNMAAVKYKKIHFDGKKDIHIAVSDSATWQAGVADIHELF